MTDEAELYRKAYEREREARKAAEKVVEDKTRELFRKNQDLESSLKKLQDQQRVLVQNEKLATLGTLAAGVAHEINNPMAFVYANAETLGDYVPIFVDLYDLLKEAVTLTDKDRDAFKDKVDAFMDEQDLDFIFEELPEMITDTREGVDRVREIVLNLRSFARTQSEERNEADMVAGLQSTLKLLTNEFKTSVRLDLKLNPVPMVLCNANELNQVFLNILVNAAHGVEGVEGATVGIETSADNDWVYIDIRDNGTGMPEDVRAHIFEPFYTTKPAGKGTGMGLSIAHGIISDHGGDILVESALGEGTHFRITLPTNDKKR